MSHERCIQIHWTCKNVDEARQIAGQLVQKGWVACAQIVPSIESIFIWNHQQETTLESLVVFKTQASWFEEVKKYILEHASYEIPEILQLPITGGNEAYLEWVVKSTGGKKTMRDTAYTKSME